MISARKVFALQLFWNQIIYFVCLCGFGMNWQLVQVVTLPSPCDGWDRLCDPVHGEKRVLKMDESYLGS